MTNARDLANRATDSVSVKDFGAVGNGTTDDTAAIQAAINAVRASGQKLFAVAGDSYRITSKIRTQTTGTYAPVTIDFQGAEIVVDFDTDDGFLIEGGSNRQTIENLSIRPSAAYVQAGTYVSTAVGVRVLNARTNITAIAQQFKGDGFLIESTASNSNTSVYDIYASQCGRGILVTGSFDDISVCQSKFRAYSSLREGIRVADTCAMRQWTGFWYAEGNWVSDPNNAANFGVYIGKATGCDLWIYCEQTGTASEVYASPTLTPYTTIISARQNKDVITGTAVSVQGRDLTQIDYNVSSGLSRNAQPLRLVGKMARTTTAGEYVRVPFVGASDVVNGYVRGELLGMHLDAPGGNNSLSVADAYLSLGGPSSLAPRRVFTGSQTLTTATSSATVVLAAISSSRSCAGRMYISGRSGGGSGQRIQIVDFYISGTTLTLNTPVVDVNPATPPSITLSVTAGNLQLALSYSSGTWGASYNFSYSVELTWA
jgi:hypothetical protein